MAVTETLRALGSWGLTFKETLPDDVWKKIGYYGHIAVHVGAKPGPLDDSLLRSARYVGVLIGIDDRDEMRSISGAGMALWLGDSEGKGNVFKDPLVLNGNFDDVITAALPPSGSVTAGAIFDIGETFTGTFQFQDSRSIIDYICQTVDAAWRVNGDGTLDAGLESQLFTVNPKCILVRKKVNNVSSADDMFLHGLSGSAETARDVEDYTTGVLLLGQGINGQFVSAEVNTPAIEIPYKDIHGNTVKFTRIATESETDEGNAEARAQLLLNRFKSTRDALTLTSSNYDIKGTAQVGDYIWVYDTAMDLVDSDNEVIFRGERTNPLKLKLTEVTWPITSKMSVFYRSDDGEWVDLTRFVQPETGESALVVGGYNRSLTEGGGGVIPITPPPDTSVPAVVTWNDPFVVGVYQSQITGEARGDVVLDWNQPLNTDSSVIVDGSHYEIRYRRATTPMYPVTWGMVENEGDTWGDKEAAGVPFRSPIQYPETTWQEAVAPFDTTKFRLQELVPAMPYEVQIRAVDLANPTNRGAWSDIAFFQTTADDIPPSTPAPPFIVSNPLAVQMTHELGRATGGTFNLERDLHHLELHGGTEPLFSPTDSTLLGKALANYGAILGQVPIVQTFNLNTASPVYFKVIAVDEAGNKSLPSTAVVASMGLINSQYVSELTASKISAGTISSQVLVAGRISTAPLGTWPRVEMTNQGINVFDLGGNLAAWWQAHTGKLMINAAEAIEINDGRLVVRNTLGNVIVELGECSDGRHGLQTYDATGEVRTARVGELAAGGNGIEVIDDVTGQLVKVSTLAFGTKAADIFTQEGTSANAYVNLATVGPFVTVNVGNAGRAIVTLTCSMIVSNNPGSGFCQVGVDIAGPGGYFQAASQIRGLWMNTVAGSAFAMSKSFLITGLNAGSNTFQMKYRSDGTNITSFFDRHILVQPF